MGAWIICSETKKRSWLRLVPHFFLNRYCSLFWFMILCISYYEVKAVACLCRLGKKTITGRGHMHPFMVCKAGSPGKTSS